MYHGGDDTNLALTKLLRINVLKHRGTPIHHLLQTQYSYVKTNGHFYHTRRRLSVVKNSPHMRSVFANQFLKKQAGRRRGYNYCKHPYCLSCVCLSGKNALQAYKSGGAV